MNSYPNPNLPTVNNIISQNPINPMPQPYISPQQPINQQFYPPQQGYYQPNSGSILYKKNLTNKDSYYETIEKRNGENIGQIIQQGGYFEICLQLPPKEWNWPKDTKYKMTIGLEKWSEPRRNVEVNNPDFFQILPDKVMFKFSYFNLKSSLGNINFDELDKIDFKNGNRPFYSIEYKSK